MYLESIFLGSDDIRQQLPQEAKRFDTIDRCVARRAVQVAHGAMQGAASLGGGEQARFCMHMRDAHRRSSMLHPCPHTLPRAGAGSPS